MSLTVTAVASWTSVPQVTVDVSSSPVMQDAIRVFRVHEDGSRHRVITTEFPVLNGTWTGVDYHAPFNHPVRYQAEKEGEQSALSPPAYLTSQWAWLIHASNPALSLRADMTVGPVPKRSRKSRAQVIELPGRAEPVSIPAGRRVAASSDLTVWCDSVASMNRVEALLDDDGPILLCNPADDQPWKWIQPGSETYDLPSGRSKDVFRSVSFSYQVVSQPDVDLTSPWNVGGIAAQYATVGAIAAAFSTVRGVALNLPGT